jgi:hypothetical protein
MERLVGGRHRGSWKVIEVHAEVIESELGRAVEKVPSSGLERQGGDSGVGGSAKSFGKGRPGRRRKAEPVSRGSRREAAAHR